MADPVRGVCGRVFAHLVDKGPSTTEEIATALKLTNRRVQQALASMHTQNKVRKGEMVPKAAPARGARGHKWEPVREEQR